MTSSFMEVRSSCEYENKGWVLSYSNNAVRFKIVEDSNGCEVLVPYQNLLPEHK